MAKKKAKAKTSNKPASFEEALVEVEKIVFDLEEGKIGLAEAMDRYEQGVALLKDCYQLLEKAENRIQQLSGVDADGNPITQPFAQRETGTGDGSPARATKRSAAANDVDDGNSLF